MIIIKRKVVENIFKHGQQEAPFEACGYLAGRDNQITNYYPMTNIDKSEDHFTLDPKEQFAVLKETRAAGLTIIAIAHTHPTGPAKPSDEDIKLAFDPDTIYVIASLIDQKNEIKAFKIRNGISKIERLEII